jgi:hypothetical protein
MADEHHWGPPALAPFPANGRRSHRRQSQPMTTADDNPPRCCHKRSIDGASGRDRFHQRLQSSSLRSSHSTKTVRPSDVVDVEEMTGRRWNSKGKVKPGFDRRSKREGPFPSTLQLSSLRSTQSAKTDRRSDIVRRRMSDGDIGRFVNRAASRWLE